MTAIDRLIHLIILGPSSMKKKMVVVLLQWKPGVDDFSSILMAMFENISKRLKLDVFYNYYRWKTVAIITKIDGSNSACPNAGGVGLSLRAYIQLSIKTEMNKASQTLYIF